MHHINPVRWIPAGHLDDVQEPQPPDTCVRLYPASDAASIALHHPDGRQRHPLFLSLPVSNFVEREGHRQIELNGDGNGTRTLPCGPRVFGHGPDRVMPGQSARLTTA